MKKVVLCAIIAIAFLLSVFIGIKKYNSQIHVIISKKFHIKINSDIHVSFFDDTGGKEAPICFAALRVNEKQYSNIIMEMQKIGYIEKDVLSEDGYGLYRCPEDNKLEWIKKEDIKECYIYNTVEYNNINVLDQQDRRIRIYVYVSESDEGYRKMYLYNSCSIKKDGNIID